MYLLTPDEAHDPAQPLIAEEAFLAHKASLIQKHSRFTTIEAPTGLASIMNIVELI
jgi:hypothetical protein